MLTLGEELLLVALDPDKQAIRGAATIRIGLNAAGMAELAAAGWLRLRQADGSPGLTVTSDGGPELGDHPLLAKVLRQAQDGRTRDPERCLRDWISPTLSSYIDSLRDSGIIEWDRPKARRARIRLVDTGAAASCLARIERVATGADPSERDLDLAGIVHGLRLSKDLYAGRGDRPKREALAAALAGQRFAVLTAGALSEASDRRSPSHLDNDMKMVMDMWRARDTP